MYKIFNKYIERIIKSNLFKLASIYTLSNIIAVAIPFFLLPILTRYLTPYDYGILSMYSTLYSFLLPLAAFSSTYFIFNIWFKEDPIKIKKINYNIMLLNFISFFVILFILYIFKDIILDYTHLSFIWLFFMSVNIFFDNILNFLVNIYRMDNKVWNFAFLNIGRSLLLFFWLFYLWLF